MDWLSEGIQDMVVSAQGPPATALLPPTHPRGHRAMTPSFPAQQCSRRADHTMHVWNIYDPNGIEPSRADPEGLRMCEGYSERLMARARQRMHESMKVYFQPHFPVTRYTAGDPTPRYLDGGPTTTKGPHIEASIGPIYIPGRANIRWPKNKPGN